MYSNTYAEYIDNEKYYSSKFLKAMQILDERFDENDYKFLKHLMSNRKLIDDIYEIIDDIIISEEIDHRARFLVLGDFLFSMSSYDLTDPANLVFKIRREDYLKNIRLRSLINTTFDYNFCSYIKIHKKLLIGLRIKGILIRTILRSIKDNEWGSEVYFQLKIEQSSMQWEMPIGFSTLPFMAIDLHKTWYSISSFRNIWKIKRKKREMENFVIPYEGVKKANNIQLTLSNELYELNSEYIKSETKLILDELQCSSFEDYFAKVRRVLEDNKYSCKLIMHREKIQDVKYNDVFVLQIEMRKEYMKLIMKFQKLISISTLKRDIFDKNIYLPCFMDNRGRQYYATLISPTFNKMFRYLYNFSIEKDFVNLENSTFYKKIMEYRYKTDEFGLNSRESYMLIVLFIEVGKNFIKSTEEYFIKTENIIEIGIEEYRKKENNLKFEEKIYLEKIYNLIDNLIEKKLINYNSVIFKDATASGLQNYGILLGYREDKLKYLNINGSDWCDTYRYIINKFLPKSDTWLRKRKYWKKTIMTIPYNAVWYTCFTKFIESLREDGIEYKNFSKDEKNFIKSIHKEFYESIKKGIKEEFYEGELKNLKIFKYNKWIVVNKKDYKINYKKARDKYTDILYMITEDEKATERALEANNMHYLDSRLIKEIINDFEIIPIHDCFGIRLCELHLVIDKINNYYTKKISMETYSIHVII